jgi:uncharacterized protein YutE (UPF0331/DUF86 family)
MQATMIDQDIIIAKATAFQRHLDKIKTKSSVGLTSFEKDGDLQDVVMFNLQMAIQNCIDIAAHIISAEGLGVPGSTNEMFYMLEEKAYLDRQLTEKMVNAVGFRNMIAHEYGKLDLSLVYRIATSDISDLERFISTIIQKTCPTKQP